MRLSLVEKRGSGFFISEILGSSCRRWVKYCHASSVLEAEMLAVEFGMQMAIVAGLKGVQMECDSLLVVQAIDSTVLIAQVGSLLGCFGLF